MPPTNAGNSRLKIWSDCKRKAYFYIVCGRESRVRDVNLLIGDYTHQCLAASVTPSGPKWSDLLEKLVSNLRKEVTSVPMPSDKIHEIVYNLVYGHVAKWRDSDEKLYKIALARPELSLSAPLTADPSIVWTGRLDRVVDEINTSRLFIFEHKTVSGNKGLAAALQYFERRAFLDRQITGSVWLAHKALGMKVVGIYYDLLVKGAIPTYGRVGPILRSVQDLDDWELDALAWQTEIEDTLEYNRQFPDKWRYGFPRNTENCIGYFGRECPYHPVCITGRHVLDDDGLYKDVEWSSEVVEEVAP